LHSDNSHKEDLAIGWRFIHHISKESKLPAAVASSANQTYIAHLVWIDEDGEGSGSPCVHDTLEDISTSPVRKSLIGAP